MEKNKKIIKLCYLQIAFYVVFLTSLLLHFKRGLDHRAFALLIILTLLGCASALTLTDYLKSLIRRSGFDVAGVHDEVDVRARSQRRGRQVAMRVGEHGDVELGLSLGAILPGADGVGLRRVVPRRLRRITGRGLRSEVHRKPH